jgi:hypothetical protein
MKLKNEVFTSYGVGSAQQLGIFIVYGFASAFTLKELEFYNMIGPLIIGYKRNLGMNFSIGITYSYSEMTAEVKNQNGSTYYKEDFKFHTLMARQDFIYVTNKYVQMYSGLGEGLMIGSSHYKYDYSPTTYKWNETTFAFQVNAFGLRVGHKFGGFIELGAGFNGFVNAGLTWKF